MKKAAGEGGKKLSAASRALVAGNYAFIYVTTHAGLRNTPKVNEKVYFMTETQVGILSKLNTRSFLVIPDGTKCS